MSKKEDTRSEFQMFRFKPEDLGFESFRDGTPTWSKCMTNLEHSVRQDVINYVIDNLRMVKNKCSVRIDVELKFKFKEIVSKETHED